MNPDKVTIEDLIDRDEEMNLVMIEWGDAYTVDDDIDEAILAILEEASQTI